MNSERKSLILKELEKNQGILRLAPCWVPRAFMVPGGRLKLRSQDLYALGVHRGGIDERWLASTTRADNGPGTPEDEGLSYIVIEENGKIEKILLKEAIEIAGDVILGKEVMEKFGGWMVLTKFFDNQGPIPFHVHLMDEHAKKVGKLGKDEAYYFPPQLNTRFNNFPYTFFGLEPGTTKEDIKKCLEDWDKGDNGILYYSKAYKLKPGTGWRVPAGILHAPGSLVTYEVQKPYDLYSMFQSLVEDRPVSRDLLVKDVPKEFHYDFDYLVSILNWEENTDPEFMKNHYVEPKPVKEEKGMIEEGYIEKWVVYGWRDFSAKELTVFPGRSVIIKDNSAYGAIVVQGRGLINNLTVESPTLIKYGDLTQDEFFVTLESAKNGVKISNTSQVENLVILKHFGPEV